MHQTFFGLQEFRYSQTQALQIRALSADRRLETNHG